MKPNTKNRKTIQVICENPMSYCPSKRQETSLQGQHRCRCSKITYPKDSEKGGQLMALRKAKSGATSAGTARPAARRLEKAWGDAVGAVGVGR